MGCLQRNPVQAPHTTFWGRTAPFELSELVGCLPAGWKMPRVPKTAVGRNDGLFRALCSFVGRPSNYHVSQSELGAVADMKNQAFTLHGLPPLDPPRSRALCGRSTSGISGSYPAGEQQRTFAFIQSCRGKLNKDKPKNGPQRASLLPKQGTNEALKPWEAEGISRAWWYRRKAKKQSRLKPYQVVCRFGLFWA